MSASLTALFILLTPGLSVARGDDGDWDKAEAEIRRIAPNDLLDIPEGVQALASRHGCSIP